MADVPDPLALFEKRLAKLIDRSGGPDACWPWRGKPSKNTYKTIWFRGVVLLVHRLMYEGAHGPLPDGKIARHTCDNRRCCNPAHLIAGTYRDNTEDMVSRGRDRFFGRRNIIKQDREEDQELWGAFCAPDAHDLPDLSAQHGA